MRRPTAEAKKAFGKWLESQKEPERVVEKVEEQPPVGRPVKAEKPMCARSTIRSGQCKLEGMANEILLELQQMLKNEKVSMFVAWCRVEEQDADATGEK